MINILLNLKNHIEIIKTYRKQNNFFINSLNIYKKYKILRKIIKIKNLVYFII